MLEVLGYVTMYLILSTFVAIPIGRFLGGPKKRRDR